jgi:SNF2 family DNA or RNA helicase
VIPESTIREFLSRELDNFDWVKKLSHDQIGAALEAPSEFVASLWLHQKACLLIAQHQPRFMFHSGMGSGKTLLMLTTLRIRKAKGEFPRAIVFVPYITATDTWFEETNKFAPELKCCSLIGSSAENYEALKSDADLFVICYQSAVAMTTVKAPHKGKIKWLLDPKMVIDCFGGCDTLIMDEIHRAKGHTSLTFKMCRMISKRAEYVYGLTGTPFGRDLQDLWAQFYLIDKGETLGDTLGLYRSVFFTKKEKFWGGYDFKFKKQFMSELQRLLKNKSIRYSTSEYSDVPAALPIQKKLKLPDSIKSYVDQTKAELQKAVQSQGYELAGNAYNQLRQLSSGFLTFKDDVERVKIEFDKNPKLDYLIELINEMPEDAKMVIFHEFVFTNEIISNKLKELKIGHAQVWGGQRDQIGQLSKFRTDKKCRVLVINSKSGSSSLNLQHAEIIIFFEQPTSSIDRQQAEARVWRSGQTKRVLIYDLFVDGTYDERTFYANKEGSNLLKALLDKKQEI